MTAKTPTRSNGNGESFMLKLDVTLPAQREAVDPVVQQIMAEVRKAHFVSGKADDIELALSEALANAVVHGCKCDPSKTVECCLVGNDKRGLVIVVRDQGTGFDPAAVPPPTEQENIYSDHGRGIYLINQLMDEVQFHKNGTEIHMIKR
jgi:serine/threonine-protein kinase RsbW